MLYQGDCVKVMQTMTNGSVDMIFADPPYFLSNGGLSVSNGRIVSVDKGEWDKASNYNNIKEFTESWISECFRVLKKDGTIWITGTLHNIFDIKQIANKVGFHIINMIIWHKSDPPPLIYKTRFRFSYEMILWCSKSKKYYFDYDFAYKIEKKEMQDVWLIPAVQKGEKIFGKHPTQKPEELLERIISVSTRKGELVLDPFLGSGTTSVVAKRLCRNYIGIEKEIEYLKIAKNRLGNAEDIIVRK